MLNAALALAEQGIPVFPCLASKAPACAGGFKAAATDPDEVRRLFSVAGAELIGVPTGAASGIDALDLDPRHGSDVWWQANSSRIPTTQIHATRSGGKHLLFRHVHGLRSSAGQLAPGCDVRAEGGYIIWWPAAGYQPWLQWDEPEPWPAWLLQDLLRTPPAAAVRDAAHLAPPDAASVVALLHRMPNPDATSRDEWMQINLAAVGCIAGLDVLGDLTIDDEDAIADAACRWSARWSGSDGYDAEREKWDSDWSKRDRPLAGWQALQRHAERLVPGLRAEQAAAEFQAVPLPAGRRSMRERFLSPADCETGPRRGYVIKHLIAPGDVGAIIAPPGAGKSMLAPYLAYAVAQGREVFGLRAKQGRTLYVAAEDVTGMRQRVHALKLQHGDAPDFAMVDAGNLRDSGEAAELRAAVADWKPALVVIDTLGAAWAGMDENSAADMGAVVALVRGLAAGGCAVFLVHHVAKHGDGSPRGHSVLNGTLDMSLSLQPKDEDGIIRGVLPKNRNGTTDRSIAFRFLAIPLGVDEDGDTITAPMAVELTGQENQQAKRTKLSPASGAALAVLRDMGGRAAEADWRARCDSERAVSTSGEPDSRRRAFVRAYAQLQQSGLVRAGDDMVWLAAGQRTGQPQTIENVVPDKLGQEPDKLDMSDHHKPVRAGQTGQPPYRVVRCPPSGSAGSEFDTPMGLGELLA